MTLYVCITIWLFALLLLGLRPDLDLAAENVPNRPGDRVAGNKKRVVSFFVLATFLLLWFLTAFRSSAIGNDTKVYLRHFDALQYSIGRAQSRFEIGYQLLNFLIHKLTHDHHAFLIIIATIMYGGVGMYIFRFSRNTAVSLVLFYSLFFSEFASMFRQGIAMVIVLFGYQLLKNGKRIPAALLFLLATSFHTSAIICFLLFLDFKVFAKPWFVLGLCAVCAILSGTGLLKTVVNALVPSYTHYFEGKYASSGWLAVTYYLISYIVMYLLVSKSLNADYRPDRTVAVNFTLLILLAAFGYAVNLFTRAGEYFLLIAITEFPNALYRGKEKHFRLWILAVCTVFLAVFILILLYRPGWNHIYPYEFWH